MNKNNWKNRYFIGETKEESTRKSEDYIQTELEKYGCTNVGNLNDIYYKSPLDLSGLTAEGIPFVAEVKQRTYTLHDKRLPKEDVFCEELKVRKFHTDKRFTKHQSMLVFNIYKDGYYAVGNPIKEGYSVDDQFCPDTTDFGEGEYSKKRCISMKRLRVRKIEVSRDWKKNE